MKLRPYQNDAVSNIFDLYKKGHNQQIWTGATGCIVGDSVINFNRGKKGFSLSIEKAFENLNGFCKNKSYKWDSNIKTYVRSFTGEKIRLHEIEDIVFSGYRKTYRIALENGYNITATMDHEIMTKNGFKELFLLNHNDEIMIDENRKKNEGLRKKETDKYFTVSERHPFSSSHFDKRRNKFYYSIEKYRAVYESNINGFKTLEEYREFLKTGDISEINFINPKDFVIHHKDFNHYNDDFENLAPITHSEHNKIHKKYNNFGYGTPTYSKFSTVDYVGFKKTYDIICCDPYRNFVANKIVIHNSGKTVIGAEITRKFTQNGGKGIWLVHREEIFTQTIKKLVIFGEQPGVMRGKENMIDSSVFVGMVQSLCRNNAERIKFLADNGLFFDYAVVDEIQHGGANQWIAVTEALKKINPNILIVGLTATPRRTDGIGLKAVGYTALINGPQYADLLEDDYLTEPLVVFSPHTFEIAKAKSKKTKGEFDKKTETEIMGEKILIEDCISLYNKYFNGAPCIIFGASVEDCLTVSARMNAEGWKGGAVYDKMDGEERRELIEGLGNGKYNFLASYEILGEGVDVPVCAGCIKRRRTNSIIVEMQQNGRPARKYPGKKYNIIIDQCGNSLIHKHPLTIRNWTLEGGDLPNPEDKDVVMTVCPGCNCFLAARPKVCPYCGEDLTKKVDIEEVIREVPAPMEILPAPAYGGYSDRVEIEEFETADRESEIISRIRAGVLTDYERFGNLAGMIGKNRQWTQTVWNKYYRGVK